MDAFKTLTARCLPVNKDDIDTDQIIPARFLKGTTKIGFGKNLFYDWRYDSHGQITADSLFDNPPFAGAEILVAANNFGCGSSREHAPWALKDYGFKAVIAESFADIFYNNALKNSILPIKLPKTIIQSLFNTLESNPLVQVTIDLPQQQVTLPDDSTHSFEINPFRKHCLLNGQDDIGFVLSKLPQIESFEKQKAITTP